MSVLPPSGVRALATCVIATRGRPARLRALLDSLEGQEVEVVVEEDASGDGPAATRNRGWRRAKGELICFLDDDVVVDSGWVEAYLDAHRAHPEAVLQGRTEPHPDEASGQDAFSRSRAVTALDWNYATCNIAYPRALLERLGGFDEAYRFPSAEDTDLGWRARESGAPTVFVDDACAWHAVHRVGVIGLMRRMGIKADVARLTRRHPGVRHHYYREVFWKGSHAFLLLALVGLAGARRTCGASLVLAIPYMRLYRPHHGSYAGTLAALPGHAAVDAAETAAVTRGALRHRTPLI
jgi:glycosyltransferase involved in cell wall biosynthesis